MTNYIPDMNRFGLSGPPQWFLSKLYAYDPSLVIVPSRQGFFYRLAQRRKPTLKDSIAYEALKEQADTAMLMSYSLIPVTTILSTVNWSSPLIFTELTRRAPWRMGGAAEYEKLVDKQDADDAAAQQAAVDDMVDQLAKDSWGLYAKKIGTRTHMWSPKTPDRPKNTEGSASAGIIIRKDKPAYRPDTLATFKGGR